MKFALKISSVFFLLATTSLFAAAEENPLEVRIEMGDDLISTAVLAEDYVSLLTLLPEYGSSNEENAYLLKFFEELKKMTEEERIKTLEKFNLMLLTLHIKGNCNLGHIFNVMSLLSPTDKEKINKEIFAQIHAQMLWISFYNRSKFYDIELIKFLLTGAYDVYDSWVPRFIGNFFYFYTSDSIEINANRIACIDLLEVLKTLYHLRESGSFTYINVRNILFNTHYINKFFESILILIFPNSGASVLSESSTWFAELLIRDYANQNPDIYIQLEHILNARLLINPRRLTELQDRFSQVIESEARKLRNLKARSSNMQSMSFSSIL